MAFKVVLVDDDLLVLQDLETLADWGKYGFTIAQTFTNGVAALRGIREIRPDFIVKLIRFHESLLLQCRRVRMISYLERKYQDKAYRDHQMILEGLKSGDSRLDQQALAEHIETARLDYLRVMKEKNITEDFGMLRFFR